MNEKARKIQQYYMKKKEERAERDKIILKKKLELQKEKYSYLDVDKIMDKMLSNKDGKDLHNMIVNLGTEKDEIVKMRKQKIIQKDVTRDLMHETNPDTIVDLILYSRFQLILLLIFDYDKIYLWFFVYLNISRNNFDSIFLSKIRIIYFFLLQ